MSINQFITKSIHLQITAQSPCYPDLLDVGAEELVAGLESGAWTSVDLTKVKRHD